MLAYGGLCSTTPMPGGQHWEGNTNEMVWRCQGFFFGSMGMGVMGCRNFMEEAQFAEESTVIWNNNKATPRVLSVLNSS
ncbi:hypothetical protein L208DRAFT_257725 [Tricholoma matsutake]|nr:hypothetical protein L208DRAFT_257725 [Tricholoma matsutake 945]